MSYRPRLDYIFVRRMREELAKKHSPMNCAEREELRQLQELAWSQGKTLCTMQEISHIMGRSVFMNAVYDEKIVPIAIIGQRSYYLY